MLKETGVASHAEGLTAHGIDGLNHYEEDARASMLHHDCVWGHFQITIPYSLQHGFPLGNHLGGNYRLAHGGVGRSGASGAPCLI